MHVVTPSRRNGEEDTDISTIGHGQTKQKDRARLRIRASVGVSIGGICNRFDARGIRDGFNPPHFFSTNHTAAITT